VEGSVLTFWSHLDRPFWVSDSEEVASVALVAGSATICHQSAERKLEPPDHLCLGRRPFVSCLEAPFWWGIRQRSASFASLASVALKTLMRHTVAVASVFRRPLGLRQISGVNDPDPNRFGVCPSNDLLLQAEDAPLSFVQSYNIEVKIFLIPFIAAGSLTT
jgi:hypothetical protein